MDEINKYEKLKEEISTTRKKLYKEREILTRLEDKNVSKEELKEQNDRIYQIKKECNKLKFLKNVLTMSEISKLSEKNRQKKI